MKKLKMVKKCELTFKDGCEKYLDNCRQRNLREGTINHYKQSYKQFYKFFNPEMKLTEITLSQYKEYVCYLRERISNDISINAYLRDFITTIHFLMNEGYIERFTMKAIKVDKSHVETYTEEELNCLLQKPNIKKCSFIEYQSWVMTYLLFSTGIRQRSLINIKVKDVDFDNNLIHVNVTKNRKPLIVPVNQTMINVLSEYLKYRQHKNTEEYLFCSGTNLFVKVPNAQTNFSFAKTINVAKGATYKAYTDISCKEEYCIPSYVVNDLKEKNNVYYFLVSNGDELPQVYTVTVRRRPKYTVTFNTDGGSYVTPQTIEEDALATKPNNPTKTGYDFVSWDYDFNTAITGNKTIKASWNARNDTPYRVEYYLEDIENNGYVLAETETEILTGKTGTTIYAEIKTFDHYTPTSTNVFSILYGDGKVVLRVYYRAQRVTVTNANIDMGVISGEIEYKYGQQISIKATPYRGYIFLGWYNEDECLETDYVYNSFACDMVARFCLDERMSIFNFDSTLDTCVVNGVKDSNIEKLIFPEYVTHIGYQAFSHCVSLKQVILNEGLIEIGHYAFSGCTKIKVLIIPKSVIYIGTQIMFGCAQDCLFVEAGVTNDRYVDDDWNLVSVNPHMNALNAKWAWKQRILQYGITSQGQVWIQYYESEEYVFFDENEGWVEYLQ